MLFEKTITLPAHATKDALKKLLLSKDHAPHFRDIKEYTKHATLGKSTFIEYETTTAFLKMDVKLQLLEKADSIEFHSLPGTFFKTKGRWDFSRWPDLTLVQEVTLPIAGASILVSRRIARALGDIRAYFATGA